MASPQTSTRRNSTNTSERRAETTARAQILDMLKNDHKRVKKAFRDFNKLDPNEDSDRCQSIITEVCSDLEIHTALEEEFFYPAARNCIEDEVLMDEAEVEHTSAKTLIGDLKNKQPGGDKYVATFKVLGEYVNHHIAEEEKEMFPKLSRAKLEWQRLLDEMTERRAVLLKDRKPSATDGDDGDAGMEAEEGHDDDQ